MNIRTIIFENRKKQNYTQEQLADKLNISSKSVSNWERGVSYPDILLIPKLCELLAITTNEFFEVEDIKRVEGKNILDDKKLNKFKVSMIISIILLFTPLTILLGTLTGYNAVTQFFTIFSSIAILFSIASSVVVSISFNKYIVSNYNSINYKNTLKNYNLIYYCLITTILAMLSILLSNMNTILIINLVLILVFVVSMLIMTKRLNFIYRFNEKKVYIITSLILLFIGITLGVLKVYLAGYLFVVILVVPIILFTVSLINLEYRF